MGMDMLQFEPSVTTIDESIEELEHYMNAHHSECPEKRMPSALATDNSNRQRRRKKLAPKVIKNLLPNQRSSYESLKSALQDHFGCQHLVFVERNSFFKMNMEESESIDNYATCLRTQAGKCNIRILC